MLDDKQAVWPAVGAAFLQLTDRGRQAKRRNGSYLFSLGAVRKICNNFCPARPFAGKARRFFPAWPGSQGPPWEPHPSRLRLPAFPLRGGLGEKKEAGASSQGSQGGPWEPGK